MGYSFSARSKANLVGVHEDLKKVVHRALQISKVDFMVIEGVRSLDRQKDLVRQGASKTLNSRHLTGHAVDLVPWVNGEISWAWPNYYPLADAMKTAAEELGVDLEWGGDWKTFKDGPHFQLSWKSYPKE